MAPNNKHIISILFSLYLLSGCKKITEIPAPIGTITPSQVFTNDNQVTSAISGLYYNMINTNGSLFSYGISILGGMSADELLLFGQSNKNYAQFEKNSLLPTNDYLTNSFWGNAYSIIYSANAISEGLKSYSGINDSLKNEINGEVEFVKAFCNFYLVNLFGDVPLVTTINWHKTNLLNRTSSIDIYQAIITSLKVAKELMATDYSVGHGQRIIPNKWAATALLARVYLYTGDWSDAEAQATTVINNSNLYALENNLNNVFLINSTEAIWQLQQSNSGSSSSYNATPEGFLLIPPDSTVEPFAYLTTQLLNAFEPNDQRKKNWVDQISYDGTNYYIPYKYKVGSTQAVPNGTYSEYYMILRLAEQYLIRAEAEAKGAKGGITGAIADLNIIRHRAGLFDYNGPTDQNSILNAIYHEKQVELFSEWGARWLDLKRTNQANNTLAPIKSGWSANDQLYPIPQAELITDPNLTQNAGY